MPAPFVVGMSSDILIEAGYRVRFTALDASTGNLVSGVNISAAYVIAADVSEQSTNPADLAPSPLLVPSDQPV